MSTVKGFYTAEQLSLDVAGIVYRHGKAQIFNVLESQFENENDRRLAASKRLVESILTNIGRDARQLILDVLGDWEQEVPLEPGDILTGQDAEDAKNEHQEDVERFGGKTDRNCETCGNRMPLSVVSIENPSTRCNRAGCNSENRFPLWEPSCGTQSK